MPSTQDAELTIRCKKSERDAWHKYADARGVSLSELIRTMCNNVCGINDPPRMDIFNHDELPGFSQHFAEEDARREKNQARKMKVLTVALAVAVVFTIVLGADELARLLSHVHFHDLDV